VDTRARCLIARALAVALAVALAAALPGIAIAARPPARAPELVIAHENLAEVGASLNDDLARFLRRIEEVAGWPQGFLRGKAFVRPALALAYIKKQKSAFAILPAHEFVEGRQELKLEVLGRAVWIDGDQLAYFTVTRQPHPFEGIASAAGMRLATTDTHDLAWLTLMFDHNLDLRRMRLVETPTTAAAVKAVVDKNADLALVPEGDWNSTYGKRAEPGGDLEWAFRSGNTPPSAVLSVGKHAAPADSQKLAAAVAKICKTTGAAACGRLRIQYIEAGRAETYAPIIEAYDSTKASLARQPRR
jgi:hypothetical protein